MVRPRIDIPYERIAELCRRWHIRRLCLFGLALRDDFGPESDLDVLAEFDDNNIPGLAFFGIQEELSRLMGRKVDLNTPGFLSRHFRQQVLNEAFTCYAQA